MFPINYIHSISRENSCYNYTNIQFKRINNDEILKKYYN